MKSCRSGTTNATMRRQIPNNYIDRVVIAGDDSSIWYAAEQMSGRQMMTWHQVY